MSGIIEFAKPTAPSLSPFPDAVRPVLGLDSAIPEKLAPLRDFICAAAEFLQVSVEAVAPLAMGIGSLACSRGFEAEPMLGWREPAPLWFVVLAEPGERKSAMLSLLAEPLHQWQADERVSLKFDLAKYGETRETLIARLKGVRIRIGKAEQNELAALEIEAQSIGAKLADMPELHAPELVTADATPEAVRDLLVRNGEKLGLVSAETDAQQLMGARYSDGPNLNLYLSAHAGDPAPAHRVGRDMPLARPALSIVLCVQPEALSAVLRDPVAVGRGLVPRMLLISPASRMGSRKLTPSGIPADLTQWWASSIRRVLDCPWPGRVVSWDGTVRRSEAAVRILGLSPRANDHLLKLRKEIEGRLGETGDLRAISGFGSKLPGAVVRLALIFQVLQNPAATEIDAASMAAACAWAPFLIGNFKLAAGVAAESASVRHARRLVAALRRQDKKTLTAREAFRLIDGAADMERMEDFHPVAEILIERGYLIPLVSETGARGRPSERFQVHPEVFA